MKKQNKKTAMTPADEGGQLLGIAARIMNLSAAAEPVSSWRDKVNRALTGSPTREEGLIRAGQAMKAASVDVDLANIAICMGIEGIAKNRIQTDAELARISAAIDQKENEYGLKKDEYWPRDEAPDDVEELRARWERRAVEINADVLREFGEVEMAEALLANEDAFNAKYREPGRLAHFGPLPPEFDQRGPGGQVK